MTSGRPTVSVLVPCYNVEKKIGRLLESLLHQTYPILELTFIDDGSTDDTRGRIFQYKPAYEKRGYRFHYAYQENSGVGSAINKGLKYVTGEYLTWPDSDDWIENDSIEKRLLFLESHQEYAVVATSAWVHKEKDIKALKRLVPNPPPQFYYSEKQFLLALTLKTMLFPAGCMLRMADLDRANPKREIFETRRGQNCQILLPVLYKGKRFYMDEPLYHYVEYDNSLSHHDNTYESQMICERDTSEILRETLKRIEMPKWERQWYLLIVKLNGLKRRLRVVAKWKSKEWLGEKNMQRICQIKRVLFLRNSPNGKDHN